jgi:dTDP-glucose pyrophosphorylase/CBS domain-containing protein
LNADQPPYVISPSRSLREAWESLNRSATGICLVVDPEGRLIDTVTDGDIRRAILDSVSMDSPIQIVTDKKQEAGRKPPITAGTEATDAALLSTMLANNILHIPLLDDERRVVGLKLLRDLIPDRQPKIDAMVMAGGFGTRLMPLTENVPKPMLRVAGRPILEHIVGQLRAADIHKVVLSTHHLPEVIHDHFGTGEGFGVEIDYVHESTPLGTAGALGLLEDVERPLLVVNGDIITNVDFRAMLAFHEENAADITVGVAQYRFQVPYGVVECEGSRITGLTEKPQMTAFVSAGIYLLSPKAVGYVEKGKRLDMPDLIKRIVAENGAAVSFPIVEYWLDIGAPAELERAKRDYE